MAKRKGTRTGKYRSKFEASVGPAIEARGFAYEAERLPYARQPGIYTPDFSRAKTIIEAKGFLTAADRKKLLEVRADYPTYRICLLFQNAHATLNKKSKTTYAKWAERHGFLWAHRTPHDSWFRSARHAALLS